MRSNFYFTRASRALFPKWFKPVTDCFIQCGFVHNSGQCIPHMGRPIIILFHVLADCIIALSLEPNISYSSHWISICFRIDLVLEPKLISPWLTLSRATLLHLRLRRCLARQEKPEDTARVSLTRWKWASTLLSSSSSSSLFSLLSRVHMVLFYFKWPHIGVPALEHEQEEPGGICFSSQANKGSLWLPCLYKFVDMNDSNLNVYFKGAHVLTINVLHFEVKLSNVESMRCFFLCVLFFKPSVVQRKKDLKITWEYHIYLSNRGHD